MKTKYNIQDELNTNAFGKCIIHDVFMSATSQKIVYEILAEDDHYYLCYEGDFE